MSVMGFANTLMLDCRCLVLPRFVYAGPRRGTGRGGGTGRGPDATRDRIAALAAEGVRVAEALTAIPAEEPPSALTPTL